MPTKHDRSRLALVFLAAVLPYLGTLAADFTNWDDPAYVIDNPAITGFGRANVSAWFSEDFLGNRAPVHIASYAVDYAVWGLHPAGFHLGNVLLHGLCAVLLWRLTRRLGLSANAATAGTLIFALHPACAEVVGWVAERKTLLAACFMIGALLAYLRVEGKRPGRWGAFSAALFTLGVFSKVAVAPFPLILAVLHLCRRLPWNRARAVVLSFSLVVAIGAGLLTIGAHQSDDAVGRLFGENLPTHAQAVSVSFGHYVQKLLFPTRLSPYYDLRQADLSPGAVTMGGLGVAFFLLACGLLLLRRSGHGFWVAGALLMWLPSSSALIPISTPMADRYLYLPLLFLGPLSACLAGGQGAGRGGRPVAILTWTILMAFAALGFAQAACWRSSTRLWSRAVQVEPENPWVRQKLAYTLWKQGDAQGALAHAERAAAIEPHWLEGLETLGRIALDAGAPKRAERAFRQQIGIAPNAVNAYLGLGRARSAQGDDRQAFDAYLEALRLKRDLRDAAVGLYDLAVRNGWEERALSSLPAEPTSAWLDLVRGDLLARTGRPEEARRMWRRILVARPGFAPALERLGAGPGGRRKELTGTGPSE